MVFDIHVKARTHEARFDLLRKELNVTVRAYYTRLGALRVEI